MARKQRKQVVSGRKQRDRDWSEADARRVLGEAEQSGLSIWQYGQQHGIDSKRLYRWRLRLGLAPGSGRARRSRSAAPAQFLAVRVAPAPVAAVVPGGAGCGIVLREGRVVRVTPSFDPATLVRVLRVLEEGTC